MLGIGLHQFRTDPDGVAPSKTSRIRTVTQTGSSPRPATVAPLRKDPGLLVSHKFSVNQQCGADAKGPSAAEG